MDKREVKVSIVIPCYNVKDFVEEALESVYAQHYENWELICVDNNSTDGTFELLQSLSNKKGFQLLQEMKKGACAARNTGWRAATGEWIQFLDADDLIFPNKIKHQVGLLKEGAETPFIASATQKMEMPNGEAKAHYVLENCWHGLMQNALGITTANLFNRKYIELVQGWDEGLKSSQEYDLMFRIMQLNSAVIIDAEAMNSVIRTRESGSISKTNVDANKHRFLRLMAKIGAYLKEYHPEDYQSHGSDYFQSMFLRIRLNSIDGFPDSKLFYNQLMPNNFKAAAHLYSPTWYRGIMNALGYSVAESIDTFKRRLTN